MTEPSSAPGVRRTGAPRWVKVFAIVGVVLVVLVVVALLSGHGPGRHMNHGMSGVAGAVVPAVTGSRW